MRSLLLNMLLFRWRWWRRRWSGCGCWWGGCSIQFTLCFLFSNTHYTYVSEYWERASIALKTRWDLHVHTHSEGVHDHSVSSNLLKKKERNHFISLSTQNFESKCLCTSCHLELKDWKLCFFFILSHKFRVLTQYFMVLLMFICLSVCH